VRAGTATLWHFRCQRYKTTEHPAGGVPTRPLVSRCEVGLSPQGRLDNRRVEPKKAPVVIATNDTFDPKIFLAKVGEGKTILRFHKNKFAGPY
jgi:hypothetical protein